MARIVLAAWGSYGDLFPYVGLALELKRRGHVPVIAQCAFYRELVESIGLEFRAVPPDVDPNDQAFIARVMSGFRGTEVIVRETIAPAIRAQYEAIDAACEGADLLVSHPVTFAAPFVARRRGLPWASTVLAPISFISAHELPVAPPLSVDLSWLGPTVGRWIAAIGKRMTRPWLAPVDAFRASLGLADAGHPLFEGQFSPHGTLAMFPSVLARPQPDWPAKVAVTGFVSYNGPDAMPPELEAFLAEGPPPVAFTLGTSAVGMPGSFFEESAKAAAAAGVRGVLLTGRFGDNRPKDLPDGVIAVDYAPHRELFPRSAVVVHQCGMGTLSQALLAGRPQLAVPFANDQPDNAHRVNRLGVARVCMPGQYRSARVAVHLRTLLDGAHYGRNAEAIAGSVQMEDGANAACDALEELLSGHRRPP